MALETAPTEQTLIRPRYLPLGLLDIVLQLAPAMLTQFGATNFFESICVQHRNRTAVGEFFSAANNSPQYADVFVTIILYLTTWVRYFYDFSVQLLTFHADDLDILSTVNLDVQVIALDIDFSVVANFGPGRLIPLVGFAATARYRDYIPF
ncbi:hypothetical protein B0H19DRAFT_1058510 [Mycena capillaripes]|nr:hypothetical protein B0H19DRAFT_1058510 [Mycena capillaripes]